jgi:Protein of unknown function (DUF3016)
MKTFLLAAALGLSAGIPAALAAPKAAAAITVTFEHPDKFTDVRMSMYPTSEGRDYILSQIRDYLQSQARYFVPAGDHLAMTFTDIKLAGDFEPWRGPDFDNIRIIRAIYPPFFKFHYVLTNAAGKVLAQGDKDLTDLNFQMRIAFPSDDPLRYEKSILSDWMRSLHDRVLG